MPGAARVTALVAALWRGGLKTAPLAAVLVALAFTPQSAHGAQAVEATVTEGPATPAAEAEFPAVAEALPRRVAVLRAPRPSAARIAVMPALRFDYRPTVFYVTGRVEDRAGTEWLRISVPDLRSGRVGWVRGTSLRILRSAGSFELVVSLRQRRLRLLRNGRQVFSAPVAIGTSRAPTPVGRFYITAAFAPSDPFLGVWALETSALSGLTDWPRGGIVGLHGTNAPELIGRRVSHGCIRLHNRHIRILKPRVRPGTPLRIVR